MGHFSSIDNWPALWKNDPVLITGVFCINCRYVTAGVFHDLIARTLPITCKV